MTLHCSQILWVLYFTSEEDSLSLHLFNLLGTGGLTPPSRRAGRHHRGSSSGHGIQGNGGFGYQPGGFGGGISSAGGGGYDTKDPVGSAGSIGRPIESNEPASVGIGSRSNPNLSNANTGAADSAPLMGGAPPSSTLAPVDEPAPASQGEAGESYLYRARALYTCTSLSKSFDFLILMFFLVRYRVG
jgi:SHO1 osmosensor